MSADLPLSSDTGKKEGAPLRGRRRIDPGSIIVDASDRASCIEPFASSYRELEDQCAGYEVAVAEAMNDGGRLMSPETFLSADKSRMQSIAGNGFDSVGWLETEPDAGGVYRSFNVGVQYPDGRRAVEQWANAENGAVGLGYFFTEK